MSDDNDNDDITDITPAPTITKGFKGFTKDLKCRDFQFQIGETFEENTAEICESGFHFCEHPLNCFDYYPPALSRYCEVATDCASLQTHGDTKRVTKKISIGAEISIAGLVKAAVEYVWERATVEDGGHATGDRGAASATGYRGAASATGDRGAASATGYQGAASATGYRGAASATGCRGAASATGYQGAASATGYRGAASATGYRGAASATGDRGAASATGYQGAASATGYRGAASATGYQGAASATGYRGAASATGCRGAASATGCQGAASATGEHSVALAAGLESSAMGALGCAICCVERDDDDGHIIAIKAAIVDGETIKAGTFYRLANGEFVEIK